MLKTLPRENYPELFFGLVAPIGTIFEPTVNSLKSELEKFDYEVITISVTELFDLFAKVISPTVPLNVETRYERYTSYIEFGNQIREAVAENSILAIAAMYQISRERTESNKETEQPNLKKAYIIRQFKRPEEINLLRSVYGDQFFQVSIYSTRSNRIENLASLFAKDVGEASPNNKQSEAAKIVEIDQDEDDKTTGQRVRKTFHDADLIVNGNVDDHTIEKQVCRFIDLLFGANFISPTKDEYGMRLAKNAALRSIDLSRQVGAAIFDSTGQIISLGSNEVPKGSGGTYWDDGTQDAREYTKDKDSNDERKQELLDEILKIACIAQTPEMMERLSRSQMMDALEYGRVVHAEMTAITDASRKGLPVKDSVLYCTTFPCHMCAKHIVSSGIKRVVFLEPYPKSLVSRLHKDSIDVENDNRGKYKDFEAVKFEHFHGVTPRMFDSLFQRTKRKNKKGEFLRYKDDIEKPIIIIRDKNYLQLENAIVENALKPFLESI